MNPRNVVDAVHVRRIRVLSMVLMTWVLSGGIARSAEVVSARVDQQDSEYHIDFEVLLNAPAERVREIVTDYGKLEALSPNIVRSEVISRHDDQAARVKVIMRPCVWIVFCKTIVKTSDARVAEDGTVVHITDATVSDFAFARERLVIEAIEDARSRVVYSARLVPSFFVPPLVGPWLIRRQIIRDLEITAERIEALAADGNVQ